MHMDKVIFETIHQWDGARHLGHETCSIVQHHCTWIWWWLRLFTNETVLVILDMKHAVPCARSPMHMDNGDLLRLFTNETVLVILDMKHAVLCSTVAHGYGGYWDYSQWEGAGHLGHETCSIVQHRCTWIRWSLRLFTNETVLVILDMKHPLC